MVKAFRKDNEAQIKAGLGSHDGKAVEAQLATMPGKMSFERCSWHHATLQQFVALLQAPAQNRYLLARKATGGTKEPRDQLNKFDFNFKV